MKDAFERGKLQAFCVRQRFARISSAASQLLLANRVYPHRNVDWNRTTASASVVRASGNVPSVKTSTANTINVYDLMNAQTVILTKDAVAKIEEVYA